MNDKEADRKPWADATKVILPTFQGGGTHVNLSGVVLAKHAPNKANAMKLIEWLVGEHAQQHVCGHELRISAARGRAVNPTIAGYGTLKRRHAAARRDRRRTRRPRRTWSTRSGSIIDVRHRAAEASSIVPALGGDDVCPPDAAVATRRANPAPSSGRVRLRRCCSRSSPRWSSSRSPTWCASRSRASPTSGRILPPT